MPYRKPHENEVTSRMALPGPAGRTPGIVLACVAVVGFGLAAVGLLSSPGWINADARPGLVVGGLVVGGFFGLCGLVIAWPREHFVAFEVGEAVLTLESSSGDRGDLPLDTLSTALPHVSNNDSQGVILRAYKLDAGWVDLARYKDEAEAKRVAALINMGIERSRSSKADDAGLPETTNQQGAARLKSLARFDVHERPDVLEIGFTQKLQAASVLLPCVFLLMGGFAWLGGLTIGFAVFATLALFVLWLGCRHVGTRYTLRIDARHLQTSHCRGSKVLKEQSFALFSVAAVDLSIRLDVVGGNQLTILTGEQQAERQAMLDHAVALSESDEPLKGMDLLHFGIKAFNAAQSGQKIMIGTMSLCDCVALDLALGEEIARRTGKTAERL